MATIYLRKDTGTYYAKFYDADGRRVSQNTGLTKKREAQKIADGFEVKAREAQQSNSALPKMFASILEQVALAAASGELSLVKAEEFVAKMHRLANPEYQEISLRDYWKKWIVEQTKHVSDSTATGYEQDLAIFESALGEKIMNAPVKNLTSEQIDAAISKAKQPTKKSETGKRPVTRTAATVNKALAALRRVLESAVAKKLATHNAAKQCRSLKTDDSTLRAPFTIQEIRAMLDHKDTSDEWKGVITIAAHTGLRMGDVVKLNSDDIQDGRIVIVPQKTKRKENNLVKIPLTPACYQWIGEKKGQFFPRLRTQSTPLCSTQFARIMEKSGVAKEITLAGNASGGLKAARSFHSLRHTFASLLADADVHADVRQKLTGHSSSKIHAKYTHHDEALDRAVATLPAL